MVNSQDSIRLSVVIPAYNEEKRIGKTLESCIEYLSGKSYRSEIIVVNDGSRDSTDKIVAQYADKAIPVIFSGYAENRGKGYAVKSGMLEARGEWVLFSDADLSTPIKMFDKFEKELEQGAEVVIGTRKTAGAYVGKSQPGYRQNMGKVFTWLSNTILGLRVSDFTCGFKCFTRKTIEAVFGAQRIYGWSYDTEIVMLAHYKGFKVVEVPVEWYNDEATKVKLLKNVFTCFNELYEIWFNKNKGRYE